jgi:hypothetical protein
LLNAPITAQNEFYYKNITDSLAINFQNVYQLSHIHVLPESEILILRERILSNSDYSIDYSSGYFKLSDTLAYSIFDTLIIKYKGLNIPLTKEYKKRSLVMKLDEETGDTLIVATSLASMFTPESIFGANLEKSGTLVRGFTVGTTRDFSLSSGLRLQLSGRLSDEIEIVAALTDENTPIQPEGTTERLEELDKVFIQVKHPNAIATFGDYQFNKNQGEFGFIDRKLQGLMGEFNYKRNSAYFSVAGSRGRFNSNLFQGIEGVQGPYRLTGINNEREILIIAGTERVFLDGIEMRRGEGNDYVIEYSTARITFTPKRLLTSASRITVDFEYSDRKYSRNFLGGGGETNLLNDKINLKFQFLQEGDDSNSPIDFLLSEEDKNILAAAGNNRNLASRSGVSLALPDSAGEVRGLYEAVDTLVDGNTFRYYRFNPGEALAIYQVSFSFVGEGEGDYRKESLGNYRFNGIGRGDYLPVIFLPMPEIRQVGNINLVINPLNELQLSIEYAGSAWDRNRFSVLDDENNSGYARNIALNYNPKEIVVGNTSLGKVNFLYRDRYIDNRFTSADRLNQVEFNRYYNIGPLQQSSEESLREINLNYKPIDKITLSSLTGFLQKGDVFRSNRYNNSITISEIDNYLVTYNIDYVESKNNQLISNWFRNRGEASYKIGIIKPGFEYLGEYKRDRSELRDSLFANSLKYNEIIPFVELIDFEGLNITARYSYREEYIPYEGVMRHESDSYTQLYQLLYRGMKEFSSTVNLSLRKKKYTKEFRDLGFGDNEIILARVQNRFNFWRPLSGDLFYEVSTQRSAKLERVFVKVERGAGNYRFLGDLNNNGIADENEFEPTLYDGDYILVTVPTDQLFPVIDLKASTKWRLNLSEIFEKQSLAGDLLGGISTETFWRIEENSREEDYKKIYLFNFSAFQNPNNTIRGSNFYQQDIFLWENDQELSFRFRYSQRTNLSQFSGGLEEGYFRERSLRIKFKLVKEISNQTDLSNEMDNLLATARNRTRNITFNHITSDFSYRPERNLEFGFRIRTGNSIDYHPETATEIDLNSQMLRFNLSLEGNGRLRAEIERNELIANGTQNNIPFEMTGGNLIGKNYYWRLNFDYRLSANVQTTIGYDGRSLGGGKAVHTARAEARAYF